MTEKSLAEEIHTANNILAASVAFDVVQARQSAEKILTATKFGAAIIYNTCAQIEDFELQTGNAPLDSYAVDKLFVKIDSELASLYREVHKEINLYFDARADYLKNFILARQDVARCLDTILDEIDFGQKNSAE